MPFSSGNPEILLTRVDAGHKQEAWKFTLGDDTLRLWNPNGEMAAEFSPELAVECFQFPSFTESIRHFSIQLPESKLHFNVDKPQLNHLRTFANLATVAAGPAAVRAVRNKAIRDLVLGLGAITAGGLLCAALFTNGGRVRGIKLVFFVVVFGISLTAKGALGYRQYLNMQRLF